MIEQPPIITQQELNGMRAISVWQAWAWAIIFAGKDVENRGWPTGYRGPLAIHASKTKQGYFDSKCSIESLGIKCPGEIQLPFGAIIGVVDVVDCMRGFNSRWSAEGQFQFVLKNKRALAEPIPYKGSQGFFTIRL